MLRITQIQQIEVGDWDRFITETYGKPYQFQQQYGCQERGTYYLDILDDITEKGIEEFEDEMEDSIPIKVNGDKMGVKFKVWLAEDPNSDFGGKLNKWEADLFWSRNFYPSIETIAQDLYKKGLIKAGEYQIRIDW